MAKAPASSAPRTPDEAFHDETRVLILERTRVACALGIVLVPAFGLLDFLVYPTDALTFLPWRFACAVALACVASTTYTRVGRALAHLPFYCAYLLVAATITAITYRVGGAESPYYAGLNLVILTMTLLVPWRVQHSIIASGLVYLLYLVPGIAGGEISNPARFLNNNFFLLTTMVIACTGTFAAYRVRRRKFDLSWALAERSRELSDANAQLREVDAMKARFFANASHELRTPLTLMLGPLEAVLEQPLSTAAREELRILHANARRLGALIDELLEVARLDSGRARFRPAPLRLDVLVKEVVTSARPFANRHRIALTHSLEEGTLPAMLDRPMMEQILFNLVSNALKFTPEGGHVRATVRRHGDEHLELAVSDDGAGIPYEQQADLFSRFGTSTASRHAKGSGLGLALVKEHTEMHGGTVSVESAPGEGTTFLIRLPLGAAASALEEVPPTSSEARDPEFQTRRALDFDTALISRSEERSAPAPAPAPKHVAPEGGDDDRPFVLVVDDDAELRGLVRGILEGDCRVIEAGDGVEALERFEEAEPALIISDMSMPRMDGLELCRAVRRLPKGESVPFLLLTAHKEDDLRQGSLELGANDYLTKPFSRRELRARVRNFLKLRRIQLELADQNRALAESLEREQEARERAVQAEKFAALGRMATEIGHEINNPVNFLLNFARPLQRQAETAAKRHPELERFPGALARVVDGGERIAAIAKGLRELASAPERGREELDLDAEVDAILALASESVPEGVRIAREGGGAGLIQAPHSGPGQVLTNLLSNAMKAVAAVPGGGTVRVGTAEDGDHVLLTVRDDGCGMDEEVRSRIFDPFFTTREGGEGMGIGLALVHRIITEDMGGTVECSSTPGEGTQFRIRLPRQVAAPAVRSAA